jgi:hypothetical protein
MAKKRTRRAKAAPVKAAAGAGPVTLAQARALATVAAPVARTAKAAAVVTTSPAPVGIERRRLARSQQQERRRRIKEYKATLAIMKKRGVKGLAPKAAKGAKALGTAAATPLQVFAEGDSWFEYPVPFFGGGIIRRLEDKLGVPVLNLATAGDEVRYMLGVKERKLLIEQFTKGCPAGGPWDAMLFSGGGNDIVDNPMVLWIKDFNATLPPAALVHQARFDTALALVRAGYEDLIGLRDSLSPQTRLFFHAYDFAIPDGRGICHLGPWLKPTFDLRGFPTQASRVAVMKILLEQFAAMLQSLASASNVTFINGQGTLAPNPSSWHNELHPSKAGFNGFAALFHKALKAAFPNRVL